MPARTGGGSTAALWLRTLAWLRPYPWSCVYVGVSLLADVALNSLIPLSIKVLLDGAIPNHDARLLGLVLAGLGLLFLVQSSLATGRDWFEARIVAGVLQDLRMGMLDRLQQRSVAFFQRRETGDLLAYFVNDLAAIDTAFSNALPSGFKSIAEVAVNLSLLIWLDWRLALVTLAVLPLTLVGPRLISGRAIEAGYSRKKVESELAGQTNESLSGQPLIRVLGLQDYILGRFRKQLDVVRLATIQAKFISGLVGRSSDAAVTLGQLVLIGAGSFLVFRGELQVGALVAFVGVLLNLGSGIGGLSSAVPKWLEATGSMGRVDEVLHASDLVQTASGGPDHRLAREVSFQDVSFAYDSGPTVLHELNLTLPAGKFSAFVGPSGSGKSSVLNLLTRLQQPTSGTISIDGIDLATIAEPALRSQMGVVFQDTFLFDSSIRENIRLGRLDATDEEVEQAARTAQLHDFVASLPAGYDTVVGERGGRLSGGQRQRVALARAILQDPAVLLLDEATSALDPATEAAFNGTLAEYGRGRTIVSVTHRLASVVEADEIFVLEGGRLVERGSHPELLALNGAYARLWHKQSGFQITADGLQAGIEAGRLADIPLFSDLDTEARERLAGLFLSDAFDAGQVIFKPGDTDGRFYVIVRGTVELLADSEQPEQALEVLEDGDFFGERELLQGTTRTVTARARSGGIALVMTRDRFSRLLDESPLVRAVIERVADVHEQRETMRRAALSGMAGWSDSG